MTPGDYQALFDQRSLGEAARGLTKKSVADGAVIVLEGEPSQNVYLVESGIVKVFKSSREGKELILYFVRPGEIFNEVPLDWGKPNICSASAISPVGLYALSKDFLAKYLQQNPRVATTMLDSVGERVRRIMTLIGDLAFKKVVARLAGILLEGAGVEESQTSPRLSQQEMAGMVGTVREVISRCLRDLEDQGSIRIDRHRVVITDRAKLERLALLGN